MQQEVRVTITLSVDISQSKSDIEKHFRAMEIAGTREATAHNRMMYSSMNSLKVEEEADIYNTDKID